MRRQPATERRATAIKTTKDRTAPNLGAIEPRTHRDRRLVDHRLGPDVAGLGPAHPEHGAPIIEPFEILDEGRRDLRAAAAPAGPPEQKQCSVPQALQ